MKRLVLASASPRRSQMFEELGVTFTSVRSSFHEPEHKKGELPGEHVKKNAEGKARAVSGRFKSALIIGADTVVVYRNKVLGKPATQHDAFEYMQLLNGRTHAVYTGLSIIDAAESKVITDYEKTLVAFRRLTNSEIRAYLLSINPMDKAGAYAIQGAGALIVKGIQGCYYNVVGFPVAKLEQMLLKTGASLFDYMKRKNAK